MSGHPWTSQQRRIVYEMAGQAPVDAIVAALATVGPPRTRQATLEWSRVHGVRLRVRKRHTRPSSRWPREQDAVLREMAGYFSPHDIAERVSTHGLERSWKAVKDRAEALGISLQRCGLTATEIFRTLAISSSSLRGWLDSGELASEATGTGPRRSRIVQPAELERFIRSRPWLFDWRRMRPGRWRDFVRATHLAQPMLSQVEASRHLGVCDSTISLWARRGLIPGAARNGMRSTWRIPFRSLDHLAALLGRSRTEKRQLLAEARAEQGR